MSCCSRPLLIKGPVDKVLSGNIRLRHLPGEICLSCRAAFSPSVTPRPRLKKAIAACLSGATSSVMILKASALVTKGATEARSCSDCLAPCSLALLDLAVGDGANLVIEGVTGYWCEVCGTGVIPNEGQELRERLEQADFENCSAVVPSLLYDTPTHPRSVQLEISTHCNLSCSYCSHRLVKVRRHVTLSEFKQVAERIDWTDIRNVDLTGLGEPLLNPSFAKIINEIRQQNPKTDIRVVTNGTTITEDQCERFCDAGITSIAFSIDSLDPDKFARSRGGAKLERVLLNLESVVKLCRSRSQSKPTLRIKSVLTDEPYGEAEKILAYSAKLGIAMPHFSCLDTRINAQPFYKEPWLSFTWAETGGDLFSQWVIARWQELSPASVMATDDMHSFLLPFFNPVLNFDYGVCRWVLDAAFIANDGQYLSCCEQMIDVPRSSWANIHDIPLKDAWTAELFWGYRLPLSLGLLPKGCVGCPQAPQGGKAMADAIGIENILLHID